jgi:N-acetylglucosaminyldiphosphoundecaprenol N-acetyl-beta-D-mannosaminyltransferase
MTRLIQFINRERAAIESFSVKTAPVQRSPYDARRLPGAELSTSLKFRVLTTAISATDPAATTLTIGQWIGEKRRDYVSFCTADVVLQAYDNQELSEIVNRAGIAAPDGMPLVWLGRLLTRTDVQRVYGPDMMLKICAHGISDGWRHFFYGGTQDVLNDLTAALRKRFPDMVIAGQFAPPFRALTLDEEAEIAGIINGAEPDLVWVGLGTPKQDFWIGRFRGKLEAPVLLAVGAAFNFHAGHVAQAPRWMMALGLEWLFRLGTEPKRLWKRYLVGVPRFLFLVMKDLLYSHF